MSDRVIHKYPLSVDLPTAVLPRYAEILHIGAQGDDLFVWALVDPVAPAVVAHEFLIYGTGQPFDDECLKHLATAVMPNGLVWHVFEEEAF